MKTLLIAVFLSTLQTLAANARDARVSAVVSDPGCAGTSDWRSAPQQELHRRLLAAAKRQCTPSTYPMLHDVKYSCAHDLLSGSSSWICTW